MPDERTDLITVDPGRLSLEQLEAAMLLGVKLGLRIREPFTERLKHVAEDGVHEWPRESGCALCSSALEIRLDAISGEDCNEALEAFDAAVLAQAIRMQQSHGDRSIRGGGDNLRAMLEDKPMSLAEIMDALNLSRASVMRRLKLLGARKVEGTGVGRKEAIYTVSPAEQPARGEGDGTGDVAGAADVPDRDAAR